VLSREEKILVELLVSRGRVPRETLQALADEPTRPDDRSLTDLLVDRGVLARSEADQLEREAGALGAALVEDLPAGGRLGEFRLVREIGRGGMGVVYEAEQESLRRRVALKVLSGAAALDAQQIERFQREARAAGRLDHPGIVRIVTSGESGGFRYIAMELVEGRGLDRLIADGPLPPEQAVRIALDVASALDAAHGAGLVHRDIKPSNVLIDAAGRARLTDFGLVHDHMAATITRSAAVLGTPAYMSPEQARGMAADPAQDIYSLGAVLFAMLSGRAVFPGDHPSAVLSRLLTEPPPPIRAINASVPRDLAAVVDRALDPDPRNRYPSAAALAADLERARKGAPTQAGRTRRRATRVRALRRAALVVAALAAVPLVLYSLRGVRVTPRTEPASHAAGVESLRQLTVLPGTESFPSLSTDGTLVAFTYGLDPDNLDVFIDGVGVQSPVNLTAACERIDSHGAISPDGREVAYASQCDGGGLFLVPVGGGLPRRIAPRGYHPDWSPDGKRIAFSTAPDRGFGVSAGRAESELRILDLETGNERAVVGRGAVDPSWSPDGRFLAYESLVDGAPRLRIIALDGGDPLIVDTGRGAARDVAWAADGRGLYYAGEQTGVGSIFFVSIDAAAGRVTGAPEVVAAPTRELLNAPAPSRDGRSLAFASWRIAASIVRLPLDPLTFAATGPIETVSRAVRVETMPDLSPDGRQLAFVMQDGVSDLWLMDAGGSGERRLTDDPSVETDPRWSPDGTRVAFVSDRSGTRQIWLIDTKSGALRCVTRAAGGGVTSPAWSPDGRRIAFRALDAGVFVVDADASEAAGEPLLDAAGHPLDFFPADWSADGRRLVGFGQRLVLYSFEERSLREYDLPARAAAWLPDGRILVGYDTELRAVDPADGSSRPVATTGRRTIAPPLGLTPDRRAVLFSASDNEADIWLATLRSPR